MTTEKMLNDLLAFCLDFLLSKNAKFGGFGAENPSFYWSKGTHITEKPHRHLVWIGFWSGIESNGPNMPIFGSK